MTGPQDHLVSFVDQSRHVLAGAVRAWASSVQRLAAPFGAPAVDPTTAVDVVFDLAEQVLATQRAITKAVVRAVLP